MVTHDDITTLEQHTTEVRNAVQRMRQTYLADQNPGVTVTSDAYADDQEQLKTALAELLHHANQMVDTTDTYDPTIRDVGRGGDPDADLPNVSLPNAALARQSDSQNLPQIPDTGSNP